MPTERAENKKSRAKGKLALPVAFCFLFCMAAADDQKPSANTFTGFKAPLEYYDPPHELQVKSYLEGAAAEQLPGGLFLIRDAKLQTFQENGKRDVTMQAPQCIFDRQQKTINSAGPLQVQASDDDWLIAGVGFSWTQTNSQLFISNQVSTTIRGPMTNTFSR
jgi:hypothetical protein